MNCIFLNPTIYMDDDFVFDPFVESEGNGIFVAAAYCDPVFWFTAHCDPSLAIPQADIR